eukprot:m.48743 g.48743  ORF g.48743 m.48743 type:complete len:59 (+) comp15966_c0_seq1:110-286(+)
MCARDQDIETIMARHAWAACTRMLRSHRCVQSGLFRRQFKEDHVVFKPGKAQSGVKLF